MLKLPKFENYEDMIARLYPGLQMPKSVTFQVTTNCNLKCSYCYQINKSNNKLSIDTAKKFIDLLLTDQLTVNRSNADGIILDFIGGEPLLEIDLIDEIITYFLTQCLMMRHPWKDRYIFSISSNGTLYFTDKVQRFINKYKNHLSLSITIDGCKEAHDTCRVFADGTGSYDIAMKAALDLKSKTGQDGTKITVAPENLKYTFDSTINMVENEFYNIAINCVFENVWKESHAVILYEQLKKIADYLITNNLYEKVAFRFFSLDNYKPLNSNEDKNWCGGTGEMLAIDYKGDIYPCIRYMESSLGTKVKPIILGNVSTGMLTTTEQKKCYNCLKSITNSSQSPLKCLMCPVAQGCSYCSAFNYQNFGVLNKRATYICDMHKVASLISAYYFNTIYKLNNMKDRIHIYLPDVDALKYVSQEELNFLHVLERN